MTDPPAVAATPQQQPSQYSPIMKIILQIVIFQVAMQFFGGRKQPAPERDSSGMVIPPLNNSFLPGTKFDVFVHVASFPNGNMASLMSDASLLWILPDQNYTGNMWRKEEKYNVSFVPPAHLYDQILLGGCGGVEVKDSNETKKFHPNANEYVLPTDIETPSSCDKDPIFHLIISAVPHLAYSKRNDVTPEKSEFDPEFTHMIVNGSTPLVDWMKPFSADEASFQNLLSTETQMEAAEREKLENEELRLLHEKDGSVSGPRPNLLPHWKQKIDVRIVFDTTRYTPSSMNSPILRKWLKASPSEGVYHPIIYPSDFWSLERDYILLNGTLRSEALPLVLSWNILNNWAFTLQSQMADTWDTQSTKPNPFQFQTHTRREKFMFKRILLDTNPFFSCFFGVLHAIAHGLFVLGFQKRYSILA